MPRSHVQIKLGSKGQLHIALPSGGVDLPMTVARVADIQVSSVPSIRGLGVEFGALRREQERAVNALLAEHSS